VQPADCTDQKRPYRIGAFHYFPAVSIVSPLVAVCMNCMMGIFLTWVAPPESLHDRFHNKVLESDIEREAFDKLFPPPKIAFGELMMWVLAEKGGLSADLSVLLSPSSDLGIDYSKIEGKMQFFHAIKDKVTPVKAAEWLTAQIPSATLTRIPDASHEGTLMFMHEELLTALKELCSGK